MQETRTNDPLTAPFLLNVGELPQLQLSNSSSDFLLPHLPSSQ